LSSYEKRPKQTNRFHSFLRQFFLIPSVYNDCVYGSWNLIFYLLPISIVPEFGRQLTIYISLFFHLKFYFDLERPLFKRFLRGITLPNYKKIILYIFCSLTKNSRPYLTCILCQLWFVVNSEKSQVLSHSTLTPINRVLLAYVI